MASSSQLPGPNPFWSEEIQRQFMETNQDEPQGRPEILEEYEQRAQAHEQQEQQEPPYEREQASTEADVQINEEILQLLDASSSDGGKDKPAGSLQELPATTTLARLEERQASPDRVSVGLGSELSVRTANSKLEMVLAGQKEQSEPELLPDRGVVQELAKQASSPRTVGETSLDQILLQMGSLVQQALQEQVTPALGQMIRNQANLLPYGRHRHVALTRCADSYSQDRVP